jgi:valyl-tRNA synthetase
VLATALETTMRLLHPFAPFVTEEIWQKLPKPPQLPSSLMITVFPRADQSWSDAAAEAEMQILQDVVGSARMLRQTYNVPPSQPLDLELRITDENAHKILAKFQPVVERIARVKATLAGGGGPSPAGSAKAVVNAHVEIVMPLGGLIDVAAEKTRIAKDIEKAKKEIAVLEKKLGSADFISRAPEEVVAEIRQRLADEQQRLKSLVEAVETLGVLS